MTTKPELYRSFIDDLVEMCNHGQGQIGAKRVLDGIWNQNATPDSLQEQHEINLMLGRLSDSDRRIIATMLSNEVVTGVFETLKTLEDYAIPPFESGYEGSPFHDFIGRLDDWEWPENK